jgi:hypothetical protein
VEGSTENATLVTELIVGLRERGLDVTRPVLAVLDGSKALRRAVIDVFDRPVIARCQLHKIRNVSDKLPEKLRSVVAARMRRAYHADSALAAEAELTALAAELDKTHPGAGASLREGLAETLTVLRLGVPPTLARTLRSTNAVESMISICRTHSANVKRWRDGQMALRWCAAGMVEAGKQFRKVNGHLHLRTLRDTLNKVTEPIGATSHDETVNAAASALEVGTHQLIDRLRIEASLTEYRRLLVWAKRFDERQWAVENAGGLGRHLAQWLLARGETVLDVPATATARVRELSRGRRKTDTLDAAAAASVAALHGDARPVPAEGSATVLCMLDEHRTNLTRQRTRTVSQLHALMRELLPGGAPTDLTADRAAALLARIRPDTPVERTRKELARELVEDIRRLDARLRGEQGPHGRRCRRVRQPPDDDRRGRAGGRSAAAGPHR